MNKELLDVLCCPCCRQELGLSVFQENDELHNSDEALDGRRDVATGLLKCECGNAYPVIDGVPRLLEGGLNDFPEFLRQYKDRVKAEMPHGSAPNPRVENDYDYIRKAFSKEWGLFNYGEDNTWGWTLEERRRVFLGDVALPETQLRGKLLLDAGCGNGTLTAALGTIGMEVIGIDLNEGLGLANRNIVRYAGENWRNIHFVQGNLFNPPLKRNSFDLIYCSGVIHHTPSSKESFRRLAPLVKKGGRLYVWVYGRRSFFVRIFQGSGRYLKKIMTLQALLIACQVMAPLFKVSTEFLNALGIAKFRKRRVREITLDLFDAFAPQYNHRHTEEEVGRWFKEEGFTNIAVSGRQKHGFGVFGDKV